MACETLATRAKLTGTKFMEIIFWKEFVVLL